MECVTRVFVYKLTCSLKPRFFLERINLLRRNGTEVIKLNTLECKLRCNIQESNVFKNSTLAEIMYHELSLSENMTITLRIKRNLQKTHLAPVNNHVPKA